MPDFDLERYQDSAQGRASVRSRDEWGNEKPRCDEFAHDYDNPVDRKARRERELDRRLKLKANIQACIAQMELICPPKGGAA
ncbi:hypothetical protein [Pseudomonas sp. Irchel 3A5]|uniref:hypothetical protein n=1 Tax=Pseudomonas sp. Irchel 3A5 TaxID=2008911 RepID=UPI000BA31D63|nr:hypothetical protein [Pseudomonas sp. Irchel 3A5]